MSMMPETVESRDYLIRLDLGGYYSEVSKTARVYNALFPVPITQWALKELRPRISPPAWSLYTVLAYLEHLKFEMKCPDIDEIFCSFFGTSMSRADFDNALNELISVKVEGIDLVKLEKNR